MDDNEKVFLKECYICETNKYDALNDKVWGHLKVSKQVELNYCEKKDKDKVFILAKITGVKEPKTIGALSKEDSESLIKYVEKGWGNIIFEAVISKADIDADENKRFCVAIFVLPASPTKKKK